MKNHQALLFSSQLFKSKIEKEAASFASSHKISVSVAKTILMKSKWNTPTASKLLSNSKYGDKLVRSRKSHCDGKSEIWPRQPVFKKKLGDKFSSSKSRQVTREI